VKLDEHVNQLWFDQIDCLAKRNDGSFAEVGTLRFRDRSSAAASRDGFSELGWKSHVRDGLRGDRHYRAVM